MPLAAPRWPLSGCCMPPPLNQPGSAPASPCGVNCIPGDGMPRGAAAAWSSDGNRGLRARRRGGIAIGGGRGIGLRRPCTAYDPAARSLAPAGWWAARRLGRRTGAAIRAARPRRRARWRRRPRRRGSGCAAVADRADRGPSAAATAAAAALAGACAAGIVRRHLGGRGRRVLIRRCWVRADLPQPCRERVAAHQAVGGELRRGRLILRGRRTGGGRHILRGRLMLRWGRGVCPLGPPWN